MKTLPVLLSLAAACGLAGPLGAPAAAQPSLARFTEVAAAKKSDLYRAGQHAIDAGRFAEAIEKFGQVARRGGPEAAGALYWKAYAEHKAGRSQQALSTLRELAGAHPKSSWLGDAKALEVEIQGGRSGPTEDEELKLYALNGLLASDSERALPMLQKFLQGNHSPRLKEQALFVLSQSAAPEARKILLATARGAAYPELQLKAVEYLGIGGGDENVRTLDEIYRSASRPEVKEAVINAYLISQQRGRLLAIARDGKDPLRGHAINTLGAIKADQELRQLYQSETSPEVRAKALDAMGVAGDVETLAGIARREQDPSLRRHAIQGLGVAGGAKAAEALRSLYASAADPETRRSVVEALFIQGNAHELIEIFHSEKDREIRQAIVQRLTLMRSDEASQFLDKIYKN